MVRKTPRKERPPGDYGNIGQKGRRTGVTLEDTGVRDEHGMEPIPSFSSPQKLDAVVEDGELQDANTATYTADDSMEMAQSTIMEPLDFIRSVKSARRSLPRSKSPRKSLINGTPRRSVGLLSSPSKNVNNSSPSRSPLHQPPNRHLDFSAEPSISNGIMKPKGIGSIGKSGKKKRPFDLTGLDDDEQSGVNDENADAYAINPVDDDEPLPNGNESLGDFDPGNFDDHIEESIEQGDSYIEGDPGTLTDVQPFDEPMEETTPESSTNRGKADRQAPEAQMVHSDASRGSASAPATERQGKGGRRKQIKTEVYEDSDASSAAEPSKGPRKAAAKKAPKERDPNARPKPAKKTTTKKIPIRETSTGPRGGTYQVQRSETPATDNGAITTRSGRTSYKPLAAWRGEKAIFGQRPDWETPASVTDIIRTDEVHLPPQPRRKPTRKARPKSPVELEEIEEEPEEEEEAALADPWETEPGIMHAQVMHWDQATGQYDENDTKEAEIAYAARAIEMRDIAGANFKFAKTLTVPFFGSGMVHLPPGCDKRVKNSRKMQMVFFVHRGRVTVSVGTPTVRFSIGVGGQWQVPRGNFYSITNESETKDARIFFAQGCEWVGEWADGTGDAA